MRAAFLLLCAAGLAACGTKFDAVDPVETLSATDPVLIPADPPVIVYEAGFEGLETCEGWSVEGGKAYTTEAIAASGIKSCRMCMQTSRTVALDLPLRLEQGGTFEMTAKVRNEATDAYATMIFTDDNANEVDSFRSVAARSNDFTAITVTGTPSRAAKKVRLHFAAEKAGGMACIDIDDVVLIRRP